MAYILFHKYVYIIMLIIISQHKLKPLFSFSFFLSYTTFNMNFRFLEAINTLKMSFVTYKMTQTLLRA